MGESIKRNLSQRAGLKELANWLEASFRDSLLTKVSDELVVTEDLREFQRRIRIQENQVGVTVIGNSATHSVQVPIDEAWRIHWIKILHTDSVDLDYSLFVTRSSPVNEVITLVHVELPNNQDQSLYPGQQITVAANNDDYSHPEPLEVFAGDTVRVTSDAFATAGRISRLGIRYELIPPALDFKAGPEWIGAEI